MTTINRHNYETFFLLYVDGELSAAEKRAVELFVADNPDLQAELQMLEETLLSPDEGLVFMNKESLMRSAEPADHEENLLLYLDNELNGEERTSVEELLQNPSIEAQFALLKQAKLEPETIACPDKDSLYRRETKERPVIMMRWWKIAAAAVLIGLLVTTSLLYNNNGRSGENTAPLAAAGDQKKNTQAKTQGDFTEEKQAQLVTTGADNGNMIASVNAATDAVSRKRMQSGIVAVAVPETVTADKKAAVATADEAPALLAKNETVIPVTERGNTVIETIEPAVINTSARLAVAADADNYTLKELDTNTDDKRNRRYPSTTATQAVYRELDTDDDSKSLLLGSIEINKDKLRGIFRKASSLFRGKAKQEETKTEERNTRILK